MDTCIGIDRYGYTQIPFTIFNKNNNSYSKILKAVNYLANAIAGQSKVGSISLSIPYVTFGHLLPEQMSFNSSIAMSF